MENTTRKYQAQAQDLFGNWHNVCPPKTERSKAEMTASVTLKMGYCTYGSAGYCTYGSARPTIQKVRIAIVGSTAYNQGITY
jgi:hypothetical protein